LLDLFAGAGGAARGYRNAGFCVLGVDIKPQPRYVPHGGCRFVQADALDYLAAHGHEFDAVHASPPCQAYSPMSLNRSAHPDLYAPTRAAARATQRPYVIENVIGAPYQSGIVLCGSMFNLTEGDEWIQRHRNFETSWLMFQPACDHRKNRSALLVTGHGFIREARDFPGHSRQGPFDLAARLMGIDWMDRRELVQAIPPAFTKWIGQRLLAHLAPSSVGRA
jgi:DNA (cytosine-5)-methyltransferase 1